MSKDQFLNILRSHGYLCQLSSSGIPTICVKDQAELQLILPEIKQLQQENDYHYSFGIVTQKKNRQETKITDISSTTNESQADEENMDITESQASA